MKKRIVSLFLALMMLSSTAFAEDVLTFTAKSDNEKSEITVTGNAAALWGQRNVTITIFRPSANTTLGDDVTVDNYATDFVDSVYTFEKVECSFDGSFEKTFKLTTDESGYYTVRVAASGIGANAANDQQVLFVSKTIAEEVLSELESAQSATELDSKIKANYPGSGATLKNAEILSLNIESEPYKNNSSFVCKYLFTMMPFGEIRALQDKFDKSSALAKIELALEEELEVKLSTHSATLGITDALARDEYTDNKESVHELIKTNIADLVNYSSYETDNTKPEYFIIQMSAIAAVNNAATYEKAYEAVKNNDDFLGIDFTSYEGYDSLSEYEISKCLNIKDGRNFTKAIQIKDIVDERIKELLSADNGPIGGTDGEDSDSLSGTHSGVSIGTSTPIEPIVSPDDTQKEPEIKFEDVPKEHWAYEAINALEENGIINGMETGKFEPSQPLLREQIAKMLVIAFDVEQNENSKFSDVDADSWFAPYVNAAFASGIINGVSKENFGAGMNVSRQDLMVMIYRALRNKGYISSVREGAEFADSALISDYAKEAIDALYSVGIVSGSDVGIEPLRNCTRAEAAKMLYGAMEKARSMEGEGIYEN